MNTTIALEAEPGADELVAEELVTTRPDGVPASRFLTPTSDRPTSDPAADNPAADPKGLRPLALSPSRAADFKACPLLYRFRAIDRLTEPASAPAVRGTLVHAVLERMFGQPAPSRTPNGTAQTVRALWSEISADRPEWADLVPPDELPAWLDSAETLVRTYFALEDPRRFEPESCELALEVELPGGARLRGFVDRLDRASSGALRVVDYKTGRSPSELFEVGALYQLKFYALMIFRLRGVVPTQLKLLYLAEGTPLIYAPTETELISFERSVIALWNAVTQAVRTGDFRPRRSKLCSWCSFQAYCPEFGGTPPPYPADRAGVVLGSVVTPT